MSAEHPDPGPPAGMPPAAPAGDVTVVLLAGGTSRRFGADKLVAPLNGSTVLETAVRSLPASWAVVAVGPERDCGRHVVWTREDPPGGGPLAGVAAGVRLVETPVVAVVAGDMPFAGVALERVVHVLRTAPPEVGAAVAGDDGGVVNPLLAAYRTEAVRAVLPEPAANRAAKLLLAVPHVVVAVTGPAGRDVDTPADLEALTDPT